MPDKLNKSHPEKKDNAVDAEFWDLPDAPPKKRPAPVTAKDVAAGIGAVLLLVAVIAGKSALDEADAIRVGSSCSVLQPTYGLKDLDKAYDDVAKAQKANDEIGLTELAQRDVAVLFPVGTSCLVIDTDFFTHFTFYRQVRILSGPYFGKTFWVKVISLQKVPPPPRYSLINAVGPEVRQGHSCACCVSQLSGAAAKN